MRKYDILKIIFENGEMTAEKISKNLGISAPNIYSYLKELMQEGLIQKTKDWYVANKTNESLKQILDIQAMAPEKFHKLITPSFKQILIKFCVSPKVKQTRFSQGELGKIKRLATPLRIILRLSHRPTIYCLKINEALVQSLLGYHDLEANFTIEDFQKIINETHIEKASSAAKLPSDSEVKKICDQAYEKGNDITILSIARDFNPGERIIDLLKSADQTNKEYKLFFNALDENVRRAISDQWRKKYIYNTNSIEGNTMSEEDVEKFIDKGKRSKRISKRELFETTNMRHSLEYLRVKNKEAPSEELIKELHFMIQKDIGPNPGEYKKFYNFVSPNSETTPPQHVKERMKSLIIWYKENKDKFHPFILASIFHMQFELIHPFADGNGRVGRLIMNHILEQNNYLPATILEKTKQNYYQALENRSIPQFLLYSLTSFIEEYKR